MAESIDLETFFTEIKMHPGFSEVAFKNLVSDTNDEVTLKILARFTQTLSVALDAMTHELTAGDADVIWKACHKVAGSAELLGFQGFGRKSKELSDTVKNRPDVEHHRRVLESYLADGASLLAKIKSGFPTLTNYL